jgi:simple sugar transport system ATP-binding protein
MPPAIELEKIEKRFGAVHANRAVDLVVRRGTIHGIVGENGAGKSTLMSIIYGFYGADSGEIRINGEPRTIRSSADAIRVGIGMVHQHFMLVDTLTVVENVMLGAEGGPLLRRGAASVRAAMARLAQDDGLAVDPDALVGELSVGLQQRVEIIKALLRGAEVLILDEPTAVLTPPEADALFGLLRALRARGKTVILITHKLREVMAVTDRVSVMRRGEMVATLDTPKTSPPELAELMVGRRVLLRVEKSAKAPGAPVLQVENLSVVDGRGVLRVANASFSVAAGEIVGIAGVAGNGQSELLEAIAGMRRAAVGEIRLRGRALRPDEQNPRRLRELGLLHVPEDRLRTGLVPSFAAFESAALGFVHDPAFGRGPLLDHGPHDRRSRAQDGALRRAPAGAAAQDGEFFRRQPAEDRAGPGDRTRSQDAPRRAADPRRGRRRDRVHPPPPARASRCGRRHPARLGRA